MTYFSAKPLPDSSLPSPPRIHEEGNKGIKTEVRDLNSRHLSKAAEWKNRSSDYL
jgi:hypothetical protein